jgi:hypothetical protein
MRLSKFGFTAAALSVTYYLLATVILGNLPYVSLPAWWATLWPSRASGTVAWFQFLNVSGSLAAAFPVALLATLRVANQKLRVALAIGAITTLAVLVPMALEPAAHRPAPSWPLWINNTTLLLSLLLAVPLLLWLMLALPSNNRWRGP